MRHNSGTPWGRQEVRLSPSALETWRWRQTREPDSQSSGERNSHHRRLQRAIGSIRTDRGQPDLLPGWNLRLNLARLARAVLPVCLRVVPRSHRIGPSAIRKRRVYSGLSPTRWGMWSTHSGRLG